MAVLDLCSSTSLQRETPSYLINGHMFDTENSCGVCSYKYLGFRLMNLMLISYC